MLISVDGFSLAALHHLDENERFIMEPYRASRSGDTLTIAEEMGCSGHPPGTNNRDALQVLWLKIQTHAAGIVFGL
ncbi:MAG: hypothetical protein NPIRA06_07970 [Nitrospirales bacterium]|nr:MAG: hypothetical protein NPIRA06_07970 [Nitrospirales bacterium]